MDFTLSGFQYLSIATDIFSKLDMVCRQTTLPILMRLPSEKGSTLKRKEFYPLGFFSFEITPLFRSSHSFMSRKTNRNLQKLSLLLKKMAKTYQMYPVSLMWMAAYSGAVTVSKLSCFPFVNGATITGNNWLP